MASGPRLGGVKSPGDALLEDRARKSSPDNLGVVFLTTPGGSGVVFRNFAIDQLRTSWSSPSNLAADTFQNKQATITKKRGNLTSSPRDQPSPHNDCELQKVKPPLADNIQTPLPNHSRTFTEPLQNHSRHTKTTPEPVQKHSRTTPNIPKQLPKYS